MSENRRRGRRVKIRDYLYYLKPMNMVRKYIQMNNEDIKLQHNQYS